MIFESRRSIVTRRTEFIVIGSGSTLASVDAGGKLPDQLLISRDIDLFPADPKLRKEDLLVPVKAIKTAIEHHYRRRHTEDDRLNRKAIEKRLAQACAESEAMVWDVKA